MKSSKASPATKELLASEAEYPKSSNSVPNGMQTTRCGGILRAMTQQKKEIETTDPKTGRV
jgi:hypothetical protein